MMTGHYGIGILPARVRKTRDKAIQTAKLNVVDPQA